MKRRTATSLIAGMVGILSGCRRRTASPAEKEADANEDSIAAANQKVLDDFRQNMGLPKEELWKAFREAVDDESLYRYIIFPRFFYSGVPVGTITNLGGDSVGLIEGREIEQIRSILRECELHDDIDLGSQYVLIPLFRNRPTSEDVIVEVIFPGDFVDAPQSLDSAYLRLRKADGSYAGDGKCAPGGALWLREKLVSLKR